MKGFFELVSDLFDYVGEFKISIIVLSVLCLIFDVWQLFTSPNEVLTIIACMCLAVSIAGHAEVIRLSGILYGLILLVTPALLIMGVVLRIYPGLGSAGDFELSALATTISTFLPFVGAAFVAGVIKLKRVIFG